eukprot:9499806-Pyramimonas_sp.AAC.1
MGGVRIAMLAWQAANQLAHFWSACAFTSEEGGQHVNLLSPWIRAPECDRHFCGGSGETTCANSATASAKALCARRN